MHPMLKTVAAGTTALFVAASPMAYAQTTGTAPPDRMKASDLNKLTDARIKIVKATLDLTSEQEKLWPAVESAIRARATDREARLARAEERAEERRDRGPIETLRERDPVDFLSRRADVLAQRSVDLKKLAEAWGPLYKTLTPEQKQRLGVLGLFVLRDLRSDDEQRRLRAYDDED